MNDIFSLIKSLLFPINIFRTNVAFCLPVKPGTNPADFPIGQLIEQSLLIC